MGKNWYRDQFNEIVEDYKSFKIASAKHLANLGEAVKSANDAKDGIETIFASLQDKDKELKEYITRLNEDVGDIDDSHDKITDVYNKVIALRDSIFGKTVKEDEEITEEEADSLQKGEYTEKQGKFYKTKTTLIAGLSHKISTYSKIVEDKILKYDSAIKNFETISNESLEKTIKKYGDNYESLRTRIEDLLPGATSAGLAAAYAEARNSHLKQIEFWRYVFFGAMATMVCAGIVLHQIGIYTLHQNMTANEILVQLLQIAPVEFPLIWLLLLANKNINQQTRLYEEYLHKWSVARTFDGMSRVAGDVSESEDGSPSSLLFLEFLTACTLNPSSTLEKRHSADSPIHAAAECAKSLIPKKQTAQNIPATAPQKSPSIPDDD